MGAETKIGWTHHTFNAVWGCTKVSDGCKHCYAADAAARWGHDVWGANKPRRIFGEKHWNEPVKWNRAAAAAGERRRVFCGSMFDWCEDHPTTSAEVPKLWPLIRGTPSLDWLLLTKRPERIPITLPSDWGPASYPNVWLGTSIEDMRVAVRADHLRHIPAVVRFVSYEPALGPLNDLDLSGIHWLIYGGESGTKHRAEDKAWAMSIRDRCAAAGVAFFHKQSADRLPERGIELDGRIIREYPIPPTLHPPPPFSLPLRCTEQNDLTP